MRGIVATVLCRRAAEEEATVRGASIQRSGYNICDTVWRLACSGTTSSRSTLTFRELETFARSGLSGFLALLHARISAEKPLRFQRSSQIAIALKKSTGDRKLRGASLPHDAPAGRVNRQIISIHCLGSLKRLQHDVL